MSSVWTQERRAQQASRLHSLKPWMRSTGPRTAAGKARSARNAYKGGVRAAVRLLNRALNEAFQAHLEAINQLRSD
jgi:hypothetical protein